MIAIWAILSCLLTAVAVGAYLVQESYSFGDALILVAWGGGSLVAAGRVYHTWVREP